MSHSRKVRRKVGDVVAIPLRNKRVAFGWIVEEPLIAFFDYSCDSQVTPNIEEIIHKPIAFRIWVMNYAVTDRLWPVVGHAPVPEELRQPPWFFKQDPISGKLSITRTGAEEVSANAEQCSSLERAAVWEPQQVVDRLEDHFAERPNKWVQSLKLRP